MRLCSQGGDDSFIVKRMKVALYKYASIIIIRPRLGHSCWSLLSLVPKSPRPGHCCWPVHWLVLKKLSSYFRCPDVAFQPSPSSSRGRVLAVAVIFLTKTAKTRRYSRCRYRPVVTFVLSSSLTSWRRAPGVIVLKSGVIVNVIVFAAVLTSWFWCHASPSPSCFLLLLSSWRPSWRNRSSSSRRYLVVVVISAVGSMWSWRHRHSSQR